ncbi:WD40 repeat-like protein [Decorospora gaudefroyi]|uniref:WD40 repeat-like protein n=1 Tax=Decorospora gaudefroyi TaxID=184978 RepID=A0A6A5K6E6_9PLEO|nr:WD40 repeat-like protein [Decorospora gaudefroyi]
MASPHLDHYGTAPHSTTTNPTTPPHNYPQDGAWPHSPNALAAAVTLATLSDSRPPTSHGDDEEEVDNDDSGGISLADYQQFVEDMPGPHTMEDDESDAMGSQMQDYMSLVQLSYAAHAYPFEMAAASSTPHHMPTVHLLPPPVFMGHLSSSGPSLVLEPPPTQQELHLLIQDKGSFMPITTFFHCVTPPKPTVPGLDLIEVPPVITRDDLQGDMCDFQGIDWSVRNTSRQAMRKKRFEYESEVLPRRLREVRKCIPRTPDSDTFFQFRRNNTAPRAFVPHFQLRNVLTATSRNDIFYANGHHVCRTDAQGSPSDVVVDLGKNLAADCSITTIASRDNVLIAGAVEGEYAITDLSSTYGSLCTFGRTTDFATDTKSRIVNHMHLFPSRHTYTPQAVLCSNDYRLRVLDCATNTFTHSFLYPAAVNCSATSPNGRMRIVVGDFPETLITNAETGQPFETLNSHTDDAFACAWADDGIHIATAAQDSTIVIWDARYWSQPLTVMTSQVSVPRSLHFSPVGSGPRVLVAAEADDYINIINAQTFESKQVLDFFGPIGGAAFTPDGQSLFIANTERRFNGIVELERTGWAESNAPRKNWESCDWVHEDALSEHEGVLSGDVERRRRHVDLSQIVV